MHEAGAARELIEAACRVASARGAPITALTIEVDESSCDVSAVRLHTLAAAAGTAAEGADVRIRPVPDLDRGDMRLASVTLEER